MPARTFLLVACLLALPLFGQPPGPGKAGPASPADTSIRTRTDSLARIGRSDPPPPDSLAAPKSRADTVLVVKHRFDHREQIITGSVVMTCLALMMVVMNNYNPR